jgi:tight adherence protein C
MTTLDLITIAGFLCFTGLSFSIGIAVMQLQRDRLRERLWGAADGGDVDVPWDGGGSTGAAPVVPGKESAQQPSKLDQEILRAGWYRASAKRNFLAFRNGGMLFVLIFAGVVAVVFGPEHSELVARTVMVGLAGITFFWAFPRIYLRNVGNRRVKRIQQALPDALDLMTMCLTGGLSLHDSFDHVSREIWFAYPDLAKELQIVKRQTELRSSEFAFQQFSRRIDAPEIVALSSLIAQGQRLGTDVVTSIREYADNMRLRRRQAADERSSKAGVKMLFPLTMCLLPSVFILLWGPSVLELFLFLQSFEGASSSSF